MPGHQLSVQLAKDTCDPWRKSGMTGRVELDVLVIGGVGIDTIVRVPGLPLADVDTVPVEPIESYLAHTGHGVALGCHLLGLNAGLVDVIGDDPEGARIRRAYDEARHPAARRPAPERHPPIGQPGRPGRPPALDVRRPPPERSAGRPEPLAPGDAPRAARARLDHGLRPRRPRGRDLPPTARSPPTCTTGTAATTTTRTSRPRPTSSSSPPPPCPTTASTGSSPTAAPR